MCCQQPFLAHKISQFHTCRRSRPPADSGCDLWCMHAHVAIASSAQTRAATAAQLHASRAVVTTTHTLCSKKVVDDNIPANCSTASRELDRWLMPRFCFAISLRLCVLSSLTASATALPCALRSSSNLKRKWLLLLLLSCCFCCTTAADGALLRQNFGMMTAAEQRRM